MDEETVNEEKSAAFADEIPAQKEKKNMAFETSNSSFSTQPGAKKNRNKVIIAIIVIVALIAGFLLYRNIAGRQTEKEDTVETSKPTKTATPTPELNKDDLKIQILNGTGTEGEATKVADLLKDAGFTNIETDNADSYDNTTTIISAKSGALEFAEEMKEALSEDFDSITVDEDLDEDSDFDVVITTGREKTEEDTTPTPTGAETTETPTPSPTPAP